MNIDSLIAMMKQTGLGDVAESIEKAQAAKVEIDQRIHAVIRRVWATADGQALLSWLVLKIAIESRDSKKVALAILEAIDRKTEEE